MATSSFLSHTRTQSRSQTQAQVRSRLHNERILCPRSKGKHAAGCLTACPVALLPTDWFSGEHWKTWSPFDTFYQHGRFKSLIPLLNASNVWALTLQEFHIAVHVQYKQNLCMPDVTAYPLLTWIEQPKRNGKQENTARHSDGLLCDSALRSIPIGD